MGCLGRVKLFVTIFQLYHKCQFYFNRNSRENSSPSVNKRQRKTKGTIKRHRQHGTQDRLKTKKKNKQIKNKTQRTKMITSKCLTKCVTYDCIEFTLSRTVQSTSYILVVVDTDITITMQLYIQKNTNYLCLYSIVLFVSIKNWK